MKTPNWFRIMEGPGRVELCAALAYTYDAHMVVTPVFYVMTDESNIDVEPMRVTIEGIEHMPDSDGWRFYIKGVVYSCPMICESAVGQRFKGEYTPMKADKGFLELI